MLAVLDVLLTVLHVGVVLAFTFLWIPRSTARLHGWLVSIVAFSWLGFGMVKGIGYCFLTDLHWRVKHARGIHGLPGSFIKYAGDYVTGTSLPPRLVDAVAMMVFVIGCGAAVFRYGQRRRAAGL